MDFLLSLSDCYSLYMYENILLPVTYFGNVTKKGQVRKGDCYRKG